ncbi:MAG: hypothetical protein ACFB20_07170 [Opitutales bacterium]
MKLSRNHLLAAFLGVAVLFTSAGPVQANPSDTAADERRAKLIQQGYRDFTSADGSKTLFAKVTDIEADMKTVSMTLDSGQDLNRVMTAAFSKADQEYFKAWAREQYFAADNALRVDLDRRRDQVDDYQKHPYVRMLDQRAFDYELERISFSVLVENRRELSLEGARMEYRLYVLADVPDSEKPRGEKEWTVVSGQVPMPAIPPRSKAEAETEMVDIMEVELKRNWDWTEGGREKFKDELKGVWIRLYKNDTLLYEESMPSSVKDSRVW